MKLFKIIILLLSLMITLVGCNNKDAGVASTDVSTPDTSVIAESTDESTTDSVSDSNETTSTIESQTTQNETPVDTSIPKTENDTKSSANQTATSKSEETKKPVESNKPTESSKPQETSKSTEPSVPKSSFAKPFDTAAMKSELIAYGNRIGIKHVTHMPDEWGGGQITPDGTTWLPPHETSNYTSSMADKLKKDLCDRIKYWKNDGAPNFTLWFEKDSRNSGDYIIYIIIT